MAHGWQFIPASETASITWDEKIAACCNETPFAYTGWLNRVSPGWGALVNEEQQLLMPLPFKSRFLLPYITQPAFTQQLGVFGAQLPTAEQMLQAMAQIPRHLVKVYLQCNTGNYFPSLPWKTRPTYCLDLNQSTEALHNRMHPHHRRNLMQAQQYAQQIHASADVHSFVELFKSTTGQKDATLTAAHYTLMTELMTEAVKNDTGKLLLCTGEAGQLTAGLFYLQSRTRLINLFNFSTEEGRKQRAMYLLLHHWIMAHACTHRIIDFEGSSIPSIATFYERFGAEKHLYPVFERKGFL